MSDLPFAYPVPWLFIREHAPTYGVKNGSLETLRHVSFSLIGPGAVPAHAPVSVEPGGIAWVPISGSELARATLLVVRWRRENGDEYLWRAAF